MASDDDDSSYDYTDSTYDILLAVTIVTTVLSQILLIINIIRHKRTDYAIIK